MIIKAYKDIFDEINTPHIFNFKNTEENTVNNDLCNLLEYNATCKDYKKINNIFNGLTGYEINKSNNSVYIFRKFQTNKGNKIKTGPNIFVNNKYKLYNIPEINIGKNVKFEDKVNLITNNKNDKIIIEDNVKIKAGSTILPGVHIGANSIIHEGSVVTEDIPMNSQVNGIPATII
jgi:acetyltransferase-like isoleucine patch superfamily enzyme